MREYPGKLYHKTPGWVMSGALFHVRLRAEPTQGAALTDSPLALELIAAARRYHEFGRWWCKLFLLMPDHVHAIIAFPREPGMSVTVRDWKRGTTRFQGVCWQMNYFDHRLRNDEEVRQAWSYIRRNPVAKGLCPCKDDWAWRCSPAGEHPYGQPTGRGESDL